MTTSSPASIRPLRAIFALAIVAATFFAQEFGFWTKFENDITEFRMRHSKSPATGDIAFIAIDKKTLDHVGSWPWPRGIFADAINKAMEYNANDIFLDVDFSAPSFPDQDQLLENALEGAEGAVTLPVFSQSHSVDPTSTALSESRPLPQFEAHTWLASVNVIPQTDGIVRQFPYAQELDGETLLSVPSVLSGITGESGTQFGINFSIDANSIPTYSLADLLDGTLEQTALQNKSVVIGAHAIELRDTFAVPVFGMLSGAKLQILAAETLAQNRQLSEVRANFILAATGLLIFGFFYFLRSTRISYRLLVLVSLATLIEIVGYMMLKKQSVILPTVSSHVLLANALIFVAYSEINIRGWMAKLAFAQSRNAKDILSQIFEDSSDAMIVLDSNGCVLENSRTALSLFGSAQKQTSGVLSLNDLPSGLLEEAMQCMSDLQECKIAQFRAGEIQTGQDADLKFIEYVISPSMLYTPVKGAHTTPKSTVIASITAQDVTEKRHQTKRLEYLSSHDELSGALQRHAFTTSIDDAYQWDIPSDSIAIFAFSLRRFDTINATLGRDIGDSLLKSVVERLKQSDLGVIEVARVGGGTFAIATKTSECHFELAQKASAFAELLEQTFVLSEASVQVGAHIGYAKAEIGSTKTQDLLGNAELALQDAKQSDTSSIAAYDPISSAKQARAREIERSLLPALERNEFFVVYQPQIDVKSNTLIGVEALLRWKHPTLGAISPDEFIEIAEANGFIDQLGKWVLDKACMDSASWPREISVAVNVSPMQFLHSDIVSEVKEALNKSGLNSSQLHLEITESSFLESSDELVATLNDLRSLGVSLALDDFGTGYASFGYISRFPINKIKVDQMFVRTLHTDPASRSIIKFTKSLSELLGLKLLCEGVETERQMAFLRQIGCDEIQGYLYGTPKRSEDIVVALSENEPLRHAS
ncbi:MAG: EAL domain-containing protein [Hyphomicrobiales bacterium]